MVRTKLTRTRRLNSNGQLQLEASQREPSPDPPRLAHSNHPRRKKIFTKTELNPSFVTFQTKPIVADLEEDAEFPQGAKPIAFIYDMVDVSIVVSLEVLVGETKKLIPIQLPTPVLVLKQLFGRYFEWVWISGLQFRVGTHHFPLKNIKHTMEELLEGELCLSDAEITDIRWEEFYTELSECTQLKKISVNISCVQHPSLKAILRPYQTRAVRWMLERENPNLIELDTEWLPMVFKKVPIENDYVLYNWYSECIYKKFQPVLISRGGILADEMGLGKTVVTIACILNHPRLSKDFVTTSPAEVIVNPIPEEYDMCIDTDDDDSSLRTRNNEAYLNPDEQLQFVPNQMKKGALATALYKWYNSKLNETKPSSNRTRKRKTSKIFKCICGERSNGSEIVKCPKCQLFQHKKCTGFVPHYQYFCPDCWVTQPIIGSAATLIVSPAAIFIQWEQEIQKHAPSLKTFLYQGVRNQYVQPPVLAEYDIVIISYNILTQETDHAQPNTSSRRLRFEERFLRKSSPLVNIEWWRLVCDEAQMFECGNQSAVNTMANMLVAVNRWSVTGTPIQRSLSDLFYLTQFLGMGYLDDINNWNGFLLKPYLRNCKEPLLQVLSQVFWRSSKKQVFKELNLPFQTVKYHFLKFTAIEECFYLEEHRTSKNAFLEGLIKSKVNPQRTLQSIDKRTLKKLLAPLLNLRQACSHPQAVHGHKISAKTGVTLSELLTYMLNKVKVECDEALRKHISALNGLAGLECLSNRFQEAITLYRRIFYLIEAYPDVHVDSVQKIHSLTNAAIVLGKHREGIPPTLRDDSLLSEAKDLEKKYLHSATEDFQTAWDQALKFQNEITETVNSFNTSPELWWVKLLYKLGPSMHDLYLKIEEQLNTADSNPGEKFTVNRFLSSIKTESGFQVTVRNWLNALFDKHEKVSKSLCNLKETPKDSLVENAVHCHLRPTSTLPQKLLCSLCKCERVLLNFECELFATTHKDGKKRRIKHEKLLDGAQTKGSWKPHKCEIVLKTLLSQSGSKTNDDNMLISDGKLFIKLMEYYKKEFKQSRVVWTKLNHEVQAQDELSMCKQQYRLRLPGEVLKKPKKTKYINLNLTEENKNEFLHVIDQFEIPALLAKFETEREFYFSEFENRLGKLKYLKHLNSNESTMEDQQCPICKNNLESQWCVLPCGHSYCHKCFQHLCEKSTRNVICAMCREKIDLINVCSVDLNANENETDTKIIGNHSTKVNAIVRAVLDLISSDSSVKILIFSTWPVVLKILALAFSQNNISYCKLPGSNNQVILQKFKNLESGVTALLLPITWGSKGLNLTEATHVFLVEPIMNAADELQAIDRVHRIGQNKETFVHRFLVKGTIEENIYDVVSQAKDTWNNRTVTFQELKNLFEPHAPIDF